MDRHDRSRMLSSLAYSGGLVAVLWVVHFLMWAFSIDKTAFANIPHRAIGLVGILTSPLVHDDIWHLISNSSPLFLFGAALLYFYRESAIKATIGIWLLSGICVWIAANSGAHIGASGLIYGFGAYLFFSGIFRRDTRSISISIILAFFYGSMVWGVLPYQPGISWESHLFGALSGLGFAWLYRKRDLRPRKRYTWEDEPDHDPRDDHAPWNYRQNWPGADGYYIPGEQDHQDSFWER